MSDSLKQYRILIADGDQQLGLVLKNMLSVMGFRNTEVTTSGKRALSLLSQQDYDILITEWSIRDFDGITLLDRIRRGELPPPPTMPIVMLTGRAEITDIAMARDHGINEYVRKPFNAKSIFNRLERIIEQPRNFVVSENFIGPDRRRKGNPPPGVADRRVWQVTPEPLERPKSSLKLRKIPKLWMPDTQLKEKLGKGVTLQSLVSPAMLELAQASIQAISSESHMWIKENMDELKALQKSLVDGSYAPTVSNQLREVALTINGRAGTFGMNNASQVAYMLYLFCRNHLHPSNKMHYTVVEKHIEVLQVIFSESIRGQESSDSGQIVKALQSLVDKYAA